MLKDYYEKFSPNKHYEQLLFRASKGLQSRELNDLQLQVQHQVKGIADVMFKEGDVVSGGAVAVNRTDKLAKVADGKVYLRGAVRDIPSRTVQLTLGDSEVIGVWLSENIVTELDDPELRDPAINAHNYDEPGAARLQLIGRWGHSEEAPTNGSAFYPVHRLEKGVVLIKQPPQLDSVSQALARYDRESNGGSYLVSGMALSYRGLRDGMQHFSLQEGKAHLHGFEIAFNTARPIEFPHDPDIAQVNEEPKSFVANEHGEMRIDLDFSPVSEVAQINATVQRKVQHTRGQIQGSVDLLIDNAVIDVLSVTQGDTVYQKGIDFLFVRNHISWQLGGNEPASGSSYDVEYTFRKQLTVEHDEQGFVLKQQISPSESIVANSLVTVHYSWFMPRKDLVVLTPSGQIERLKGLSVKESPVAPSVPNGHLPLAVVTQSFTQAAPEIRNVAIQAVTMADMALMQSQITDLYQLLAIERLRNDANAQDPSSKYGVFVDPFLDDDMRDQGLTQTAAVIDGELQLPMNISVETFGNLSAPITLPYELEDVLLQDRQTGNMKINPYQAFAPIPAKVSLTPSVDHWTETSQKWSSPITARFTRGSGRVQRIIEEVRTERVGTTTRAAEYLRSRDIAFRVEGFGAGEVLSALIFDGVDIIEGVSA
ncbi:DUF4815 domain-containing protein [Pseudoalteromonas xiamenensis]|uniref:DUF4815 domain-containing protein n=1 Tax=Pseudoalteromonas xiamenensis TaxID=882626 RepID=UPI0027E3C1F5|nr:DUF4815 domain-containing protein [Pseudoalteromonas xiamenensis]WMN59285.1 DUF4815 domain-containing protein [Pseudoalteromonas xiamenensis]